MTTNKQSRIGTQYTIEIGIPFFQLKLKVKDGVDGGGNSDMPTVVTFEPDQSMADDHRVPQEVKFVGPLEFCAFRSLLRVLDAELTAIFGPMESWDADVTVTKSPIQSGDRS